MEKINRSYYLAFGEAVKGPHTMEQLRPMWIKRAITLKTPLCLAGTNTWGTVKDIEQQLKAKNASPTRKVSFPCHPTRKPPNPATWQAASPAQALSRLRTTVL